MEKITIKTSPTADSRTAKGDVTKPQLLRASHQHISDVKRAMYFFADMMLQNAKLHDHTKIELIDEFYEDFKQYKDQEFKDATWFQKHIQERHHLKDRCPDDVNLIDVMERIADIVMAGMGRSGYVYDDMLDGEMLQKAYKNTIELLKENVEVID